MKSRKLPQFKLRAKNLFKFKKTTPNLGFNTTTTDPTTVTTTTVTTVATF